jgi:hypothetical protein
MGNSALRLLNPGKDNMSQQERFKIVPQMETYNLKFPKVITPYLTLFHQANYQSPIINTDSSGFRYSYCADVRIDDQSWWGQEKRGIALGGSFVFGEGSMSDRGTMVSQLNRLTDSAFINLGIKGGNSIQELIASIPFIEKTEKAFVCSGMNNLVVSLQSMGRNEIYAPLFSEGLVAQLSQYSINQLVRRASFDEVGTVILLKLLLKRLSNIIRGRRNLKKQQSAPKVPDKQEALRKAVAWSRRDLRILTRSLPDEIRPLFVVQPFASACSRDFVPEEQSLFQLTTNLVGSYWQRLKNDLIELWPVYVDELEAVCKELEIGFMDLNKQDFQGWVFVDQVHMTDEGYKQAAQFIAQRL